MEQRGHPRSRSGHRSHRSKEREERQRVPPQDREQGCPPPDPREWDRPWVGHPEAQYRAHYSSPPARQNPYAQQYPYGYAPPEPQRQQSRHGYDYPPHPQVDYRDGYGYYHDHDYYRGQPVWQDVGQWAHQDAWKSEHYHERAAVLEPAGSYYTEEYSADQAGGGLQRYSKGHENNPSNENEEVSSYYVGTLESCKNSGLSSSSYELSQYMNGSEQGNLSPQTDTDAPVHHMPAPLKYSIPHAVVSFGPAGQLIRVSSGCSTQDHVSQLEIHSLEVIMSETHEHQELRDFPGPLTREDLHKVDAMEFAQQRSGVCMRDDKVQDRSSASLLWKLLILLCRQNGQIVGSDIAELLMQGSNPDGSSQVEARTLIDFSDDTAANEPPRQGDDLLTGDLSSFSSESSEKSLQSYTKLLLAGRKKEALEAAMSGSLWGHALFLASKMDNRSYTTVLNRFTGQISASDPLQTLFQLLSGRIPTVSTYCANEKWGDWRPHLAVLLSNETGDHVLQQRAVVTMGDTLASRDLLHAAHVCYLMASVPFGAFTDKASRLVLLGSNHRHSFEHFATNSAIQCTELYEYCQTLGGRTFSIPSFQVYKFLYASRLVDCGLTAQAFHYCEVVGQAILRQHEPFFVLTGELIKLADRLRHTEGPYTDAEPEPTWLRQLRDRHHRLQMGTYDGTESHHSHPEGHELRSCPESDMDELRSEIQSPEPQLLYYGGPEEDQEDAVHGLQEKTEEMSLDVRGAQEWPQASPPMPLPVGGAPVGCAPVGCALPAPPMTAGQDFSYHNTDSAEVTTVSPHCLPTDVPSAAEGAAFSPGVITMRVQVPGVASSQWDHMQPSFPTESEAYERSSDPPKQSAKGGWFSGWFKSKAKDVPKEPSEDRRETQATASSAFAPPPPPTSVPPAMFPSQPSSTGINPFSRKAAQATAGSGAPTVPLTADDSLT